MQLTISQTIQQLHTSLREYIEAAYHISHPKLISQRVRLLNTPGVIHQEPFLESTPRYPSTKSMAELGLPAPVQEIFARGRKTQPGEEDIIFDTPYQHQAQALSTGLIDRKSMVIMTGTGSGKTECFLLPILGKLAEEAAGNSDSFKRHYAVRALVLYPMNALVNDQLGRLRLLFGDNRIASKFIEWSGRPVRFARYTSRTLYPGVRDQKKDQQRLKPIGDFYVKNLDLAESAPSPQQEAAAALVQELRRRGKWPAKPDIRTWYGKPGSRWRDSTSGEFRRCVTLPTDPELLTRHEVLDAPPDILVTNYSMLEYMLCISMTNCSGLCIIALRAPSTEPNARDIPVASSGKSLLMPVNTSPNC